MHKKNVDTGKTFEAAFEIVAYIFFQSKKIGLDIFTKKVVFM